MASCDTMNVLEFSNYCSGNKFTKFIFDTGNQYNNVFDDNLVYGTFIFDSIKVYCNPNQICLFQSEKSEGTLIFSKVRHINVGEVLGGYECFEFVCGSIKDKDDRKTYHVLAQKSC